MTMDGTQTVIFMRNSMIVPDLAARGTSHNFLARVHSRDLPKMEPMACVKDCIIIIIIIMYPHLDVSIYLSQDGQEDLPDVPLFISHNCAGGPYRTTPSV